MVTADSLSRAGHIELMGDVNQHSDVVDQYYALFQQRHLLNINPKELRAEQEKDSLAHCEGATRQSCSEGHVPGHQNVRRYLRMAQARQDGVIQ